MKQQLLENIEDNKILHPNSDFENRYLYIRDKEKRVYSDEELRLLPEMADQHVHRKEWQMRRASLRRLTRYLQNKNKPLDILEIGCGNGWLSAHLANIKNSEIRGIDINSLELEQAKRVFAKSNLKFLCLGPFHPDLKQFKFDIIIFAASVQYFKCFNDIINVCLSLLNPGGEIHIVDTIFYKDEEVGNAIQRSKNYFEGMGCPEMADWYFHRRLSELDGFNYHVLSHPNSVINKLLYKNPFYWVKIEHRTT
ncbi:class I SAM-dependent methyltransferase [Mucilaginibacter sp. AW1-3]